MTTVGNTKQITPSHDIHPMRFKLAVISLRIVVWLTLLASVAMIFFAFGFLVAYADGQTPNPQVSSPARVPAPSEEVFHPDVQAAMGMEKNTWHPIKSV